MMRTGDLYVIPCPTMMLHESMLVVGHRWDAGIVGLPDPAMMTQYGAKPLAMQVLKHPDPAVQKHALTCVQRLMVINWEYLNRG